MILLLRRIAEAKQRIAEIEADIEEATSAELYKLKLRVENSEAMGIDLFGDLLSQVDRQIKKAWDETWSPPQTTGADRRTTMRRDGQPVPVYLNSAAFEKQTEPAYVIDRSKGGLKIISTKPLPAGSTMQIRAENAPNNIPWLTMIVRSCREIDERYELGCEFEQPPPWNILLLFG